MTIVCILRLQSAENVMMAPFAQNFAVLTAGAFAADTVLGHFVPDPRRFALKLLGHALPARGELHLVALVLFRAREEVRGT